MQRYTREERKKLRALKRLSSARDSEFEGFITHSTLYHRMYEGYSERQVPNENGRGTHIERVYVGPYFERKSTGLTLTAAKVLYPAVSLAATFCALFAFSRSTGYNSIWYGVIPMFALIVLTILLFYNLVNCLTVPKRMELYHYNSFGRTSQSALRTATAAFTYALLSVVYLLLTPNPGTVWHVTLSAAVAGLLFLAIFLLEHSARYDVIENEKEPAHDAVVIS